LVQYPGGRGVHFVHDLTLFVAIHSSKSCYCSIAFSVTVQSFLSNVDRTVAGNIETMSLEIKIWQWICDTQYECMNIKQSLCLRCLHWCVFPRIPIIWHHDKVVRQRRSCATSHHSNITTVWLLQHLVSDRLLSLISKEIVHLMLDKDFLFYFKTIDKLFVNLCLNLLYYLICRLKYGV
jgi:hypothetical protein